MKTNYLIIFFIQYILFQPFFSFAQLLKGKVTSTEVSDGKLKTLAISNATVYWVGSTSAVYTNDKGQFEISKPKNENNLLAVRFIGYKPDTVVVEKDQINIQIELKNTQTLGAVTISTQSKGSYISEITPINTQIITEAGLQKLPCCNLSESFENNASVDVAYSDAVTGAKQIQLLGLAGIYSQILTENMPSVRGLASSFGMAYIPGPWMQSIQISKGTASVINGYEAITGQINVEYKKPEKSDLFFINLFGNQQGRTEANITSAIKITPYLSTMLLAHASMLNTKNDENKDGFMDSPLYRQLNFINRWKLEIPGKIELQLGAKFINETRDGGQMSFNKITDKGTSNSYGIGIETQRSELFAKLGFPLKFRPATSIGTMYSFTSHHQNSFYGLNNYDGSEQSFYSNIIFQTFIGNTDHKISSGVSFVYDNFDEKLNDSTYKRIEKVPGVFTQYSYSIGEKFNIIAGLRADFHSEFGTFITPRLHLKYSINDQTRIRASIGKGYRVTNVLAENTNVLASSRKIIILDKLQNEEAWNMGLSLSRDIFLGGDNMSKIHFDFYHTKFIKQVVTDLDMRTDALMVYNLNGKSYSNSFQVEVNYTPIKGLDVILAYRLNDVKTMLDKTLETKPFVPKHKGLITLSYLSISKKWQYDITNQFVGSSRLPVTTSNPGAFQIPATSDPYYILHIQVTRKFKNFDIYLGGENLTNYTQKNPIMDAQNPFGKYFDASMIWAPIEGRMFYGGLRYTFK